MWNDQMQLIFIKFYAHAHHVPHPLSTQLHGLHHNLFKALICLFLPTANVNSNSSTPRTHKH